MAGGTDGLVAAHDDAADRAAAGKDDLLTISAAAATAELDAAGPVPPVPAETARRRLIAAPFRTGLLVGFGLLVAYALYLSVSTILSTLVILAISALLAIGLDPVVRFLVRRGMKRGLAAAITFFGLLAVLGGAVYAIIPPVVQEVAALIQVAPDKLEQLPTTPRSARWTNASA